MASAVVVIYGVMKEDSYRPVTLNEGQSWRWADSSECEDFGGKMITGMGCVRGTVPENLKFNQHINPEKVKEACHKLNGTYDENKNICFTFNLN